MLSVYRPTITMYTRPVHRALCTMLYTSINIYRWSINSTAVRVQTSIKVKHITTRSLIISSINSMSNAGFLQLVHNKCHTFFDGRLRDHLIFFSDFTEHQDTKIINKIIVFVDWLKLHCNKSDYLVCFAFYKQ
jgi:hypothetical protein